MRRVYLESVVIPVTVEGQFRSYPLSSSLVFFLEIHELHGVEGINDHISDPA